MKYFWKEICIVVFLALIFPNLVMNVGRGLLKRPDLSQPTFSGVTEPETVNNSISVSVLMSDGSVVSMELENYLVGVVFAEMPVDFEPEALKAQAVVARTYTLRNCQMGSKHSNADVCVRADCCQGYRNPNSGWEYEKIRSAVDSTAGQVMVYGGVLIEATYFSSSGGRTEDAVAVWGNDVPYLRSTESPEGEYIRQQTETVTMDLSEFTQRLQIEAGEFGQELLGEMTFTAGGGVDTMVIGGTEFRGTQLRQLLGLRSTVFQMTVIGNHVVITTRGFGHRVGMSQYGAEALAVMGYSYEEILTHYYHGATLEDFVDKDSTVG